MSAPKNRVRWMAVLWMVVAAAPTTLAGTLRVPADHATIQLAIQAATHGDVVLVSPGTYSEVIDFLGKAITVTSSDGPSATTIDGGTGPAVASFLTGEGLDSILEGFTLRGGFRGVRVVGASPVIRGNVVTGTGPGITCQMKSVAVIENNQIIDNDGVGIDLNDSSPTIRNNTIARNTSYATWGGGIACEIDCSPLIENNLIEDNVLVGATGLGMGIGCYSNSPAVIRGNVIRRNRMAIGFFYFGDGGGIGCHQSDALIENNVILDNAVSADDFFDARGGGIFLYESGAVVRGNLVARNRASSDVSSRGGGLYCQGEPAVLEGNTFAGNQADSGPGLYLAAGATSVVETIVWDHGSGAVVDVGSATFAYCDVEGGVPGTGNLDVDPQFVDPSGDDWSLLSTSPCIDQGDPVSPVTGQDLDGFPRSLDGDLDRIMLRDMGCHEFSHVRLTVTGSFGPGDSFTLDLTGTTGLKSWLLVGLDGAEIPFRPFGSLFLDLGLPFLILPMGPLPASLSGTAPVTLPLGTTLVFQGLAVDVNRAGNLSNPVTAVVE